MTKDKYRKLKDDPGLYFRTKEVSDYGKFRVPSLRYTKYTAPYMHNGIMATLEEVVDFYDAGGGADPLKDSRLKPLGLVPSEKADLVAFLESLSGESFDTDAYVWREDDYDYQLIENWRDVPN